jgi:hydrogenase maturation protein HypF
MAKMISKVAAKLRAKYGINKVALSGGVFQNSLLTERTVDALKRCGFRVFTHSNIPTNDSGIPIGQIAIARMRMRCA